MRVQEIVGAGIVGQGVYLNYSHWNGGHCKSESCL